MFRALMLATIAVGLGLFGASLLRTEGNRNRGSRATPEVGSCTAQTRSGAACSRPAEPGSDRCWQHHRHDP